LVRYDPGITVAAVVARFMGEGEMKAHHGFQIKALLPFFGDIKVASLNRNVAVQYRLWRKQQKRVTDATVNRALSVIRRILYWAVDESLIPANPLARLPLVRERRLKRPVMSVAEEQRVLEALPDYLKAIIITALDTGMRRGEILKQRWEDIDLNRKLLLVTRSKTAEGEAREIPLTNRLLSLLGAQQKNDGIVFTRYNEPLSWIRKGWLGALKRAKLRHFRLHDLRHTFNTRLMEAGVIQDVRMSLMGHSGGSRVHGTYTHVELPVKRKAIKRLEEWREEQPNEPDGEQSELTADHHPMGSSAKSTQSASED
jgi:integrase